MPLTSLLRRAADGAADADLLGRFTATRDEAAFAALVERHGPLVRGVCRRMLGATDADDAAQAVFLALARQAGRVRNVEPLSGWLHAVSVRVCRRASARRRRPVAAVVRPVADPADEASWREVAAAVDAALSRLPDRLRQPLVLCYLDGLTRDEAAAKLGWPADTLRGRLDRGRARLRADLQRRGFGLPAGLLAVLLTAPRLDAGWATRTAGLVLDPAGPPGRVLALCVGGGWAMRRLVLLGLTASAAVGGAMLATGRPLPADPPPRAEPAPPPKAARVAESPARPAAAKLAGRWAYAGDSVPGPGRTEYALDILDDKRAVWTVGFSDIYGTRQNRWEMLYAVHPEAAGDGLLVLRPPPEAAGDPYASPGEQRYRMTRARTPAGPVLYLTEDQAGRSDRRLRFTPAPAAPPADKSPPLRPTAPTKEPPYTDPPLYLQLAAGPAGDRRVWLVLDGDRLFVDRNANGDLTDDPDSPVRPATPPPAPPAPPAQADGVVPRRPPPRERDRDRKQTFVVGDAAGLGDLEVETQHAGGPDPRYLSAVVRAGVAGHHEAAATLFARRPDRAGVLWLGRPGLTLHHRPDPSGGPPQAGSTVELNVELGTGPAGPEKQAGAARRSADDIPDNKFPVAEVAFPGFKVTTRVELSERRAGGFGVWEQFVGSLDIPAQAGHGPAKVTLSFPDCPLGAVEPTAFELWYESPGVRRPAASPVSGRRNPFAGN